MAVEIKKPNEENNTQTQQSEANATGNTSPAQGMNILNMLMKSGAGMQKDVQDFVGNLKNQLADYDATILVLDKSRFEQLAYTYICIALEYEGHIGYSLVEIAATGVTGMPPQEVLQVTQHGQVPVLPRIAINEPLKRLAEQELYRATKNESLHNFCRLAVTANLDIKQESVAAIAAEQSVNDIIVGLATLTGEYTEEVLKNLILEYPLLTRRVTTLTGDAVDPLGEVRYTLWESSLHGQTNERNILPNQDVGNKTFVSTKGNIQIGISQGETGYTLHPVVVVNTNDTVVPSVGAALLGLVNGAELIAGNKWVLPMVENISAKWNPGALNLLSGKVEGKKLRVDLTSNKVSREQKIQTILQIIDGVPALAMDVPMASYGSSAFLPFAVAASGTPDSQAACDDIIDAAVELTGKNFPADFPRDQIFSTGSIILPNGVLIEGGEQHHIDKKDLVSIVSEKTLNNELVGKYVAAEFGYEDPFTSKLEILAQFNEQSIIDGEKIRVVFNGDFITTLTRAIIAAGINPTIEAGEVVTGVVNFGYMSSIFSKAGVRNIVTGSAHQGAGRSFATYYQPMYR